MTIPAFYVPKVAIISSRKEPEKPRRTSATVDIEPMIMHTRAENEQILFAMTILKAAVPSRFAEYVPKTWKEWS